MGNWSRFLILFSILNVIAVSAKTLPLSIGVEQKENASSLKAIIYLLINLSDSEYELLNKYLSEKKYARLKEIIDHKKNELKNSNYDRFNEWIEAEGVQNFENNGSTDQITFGLYPEHLNLTQEQLMLVEAYNNASIYSVIYALWNSKVEQELPQIDQRAILEYFTEKRAKRQADQNIFIKLWQIIQNLFKHKNGEKIDECQASEPSCVRTILDGCNPNERWELEQATVDELEKLMESKLKDKPELYNEFNDWYKQNDVPVALKQITHSLSQAQKRAMERLRRYELKDKIKDFYREHIEERLLSQQEEIEQFFERMNKTFARCYNPSETTEDIMHETRPR